MAILLDKIGNANDVIQILSKALERGKDDSLVNYLLGKNLFKLNRLEEARKKLEKAIKIDKNNLSARYFLAQIYLKDDETELARKQVEYIMNYPLESPLKQLTADLV